MVFPDIATVDEFVAWENRQERKYEFADGRISPFPGGTLRHETIVANIIGMLHAALGPGRVVGSGMKTVTASSSRYPDVIVLAENRDEDPNATVLRTPAIVFEVLSPSTQSVDRGAKLDEYRSLPSLQAYVLIDSRKRWVQIVRRSEADWIVSLPFATGEIALPIVAATLPLDIVYASSGL